MKTPTNYSPPTTRSSAKKRKYDTRSSQRQSIAPTSSSATRRAMRPSSSARSKLAPRSSAKKTGNDKNQKSNSPAPTPVAILNVHAEKKTPPLPRTSDATVGTPMNVEQLKKSPPLPPTSDAVGTSLALKNSSSSLAEVDLDRKMPPVASLDQDEERLDDDESVQGMLDKVLEGAEDDDDPQDEGTWTCTREGCRHETSMAEPFCGGCKKMPPPPTTFIGFADTLIPPGNKPRCVACRATKDSPTAECKVCGSLGQRFTLVPAVGDIASRGTCNEEPTIMPPVERQALGSITSVGFIFPTNQAAIAPATNDEDDMIPPPAKKRRLN